MRRTFRRGFKTFLVIAYMAMEFSGHKRFVEHTPLGESRSYYGPNETCRDAIAPLNQVLRGRELSRELDAFLFRRGASSQGLRSARSSVTGTVVAPLLDRFLFVPAPAQFFALVTAQAPASASSHPAPFSAALSPPTVSTAPPQLLI